MSLLSGIIGVSWLVGVKSQYSQIFVLLFALLAFVPVVAVDHLLDGYVHERESARMQATVDAIVHDSQATVHEAIQSLRSVLLNSPSLCTTTFIRNAAHELRNNLYLQQIVVENRDGVQYCGTPDDAFTYRMLSENLAIPGHAETLSSVSVSDMPTPMLRISQSFGADRVVSAFVVAAPIISRELPPFFSDLRYIQVSLTNGTPVIGYGDAGAEGGGSIFVRSFAGEIPLKAEAGVPFAQVRARYAELDLGFTTAAAAVGALMLLMALQYVRRARMPSFDLERAIVAGELQPYYQPVINLKTGRITGCEVLVRWKKRNGEVLSPAEFIDYAEMSGLAIPMTLGLMEQVRYDLDQLCREMPDFKVSINLFEGHFRDGSIVEDIQSIFGQSGISYRQLVFEITERRPLDDRTAVNRVVSSMHKLGVRIAMDDAGTGHSNLAYLQTLGIDIIKIDKIFVDMIRDPVTPVPVIDGLISMARDLNIEIVAEGVETQQQALYLRAKHVYFAQGYLFAPPLKLSSFLTLANALRPQPRGSNLESEAAA